MVKYINYKTIISRRRRKYETAYITDKIEMHLTYITQTWSGDIRKMKININRVVYYLLWAVGLVCTLWSVRTNWLRYKAYNSIFNERNYDYYESEGMCTLLATPSDYYSHVGHFSPKNAKWNSHKFYIPSTWSINTQVYGPLGCYRGTQ